MTDITTGEMGEIVTQIGYEWVRPAHYWEGSKPFSGAVAVQSNQGWLLLARAMQIQNGPRHGAVRFVAVAPEELNVQDR